MASARRIGAPDAKNRSALIDAAEALMIEAFVGEVVESIESEALRDVLMELSRQWLKARA